MRFYKTKKVSEMSVASLYTFLIFILILFLTAGCLRKDAHPAEPRTGEEPGAEEEIECDAFTPCSAGYDCVKLPDNPKPLCVSPNVLKSDKYKDCAVAESYPVQLICPKEKTPVTLQECEADSDCQIGGCNSEICAKEKMNSICIYKPEFECYKLIKCRCIDGRCSWGKTQEFLECFEEKTKQ